MAEDLREPTRVQAQLFSERERVGGRGQVGGEQCVVEQLRRLSRTQRTDMDHRIAERLAVFPNPGGPTGTTGSPRFANAGRKNENVVFCPPAMTRSLPASAAGPP